MTLKVNAYNSAIKRMRNVCNKTSQGEKKLTDCEVCLNYYYYIYIYIHNIYKYIYIYLYM